MSNTIRPKVSAAIKECTSFDSNGKSNYKIDTEKEYQKLQDYLSGNYDDLNSTEKNRIHEILEKAKKYIGNLNSDSDDKKNKEVDDYDSTNTSDNEVSSGDKSVETDDYGSTNTSGNGVSGGDKSVETDDYNSTNTSENGISGGDKSKEAGDSYESSEPTYNTGENYGDNNVNNNEKMPGKKVVKDGKICIEMPSGKLYDIYTGREIKE